MNRSLQRRSKSEAHQRVSMSLDIAHHRMLADWIAEVLACQPTAHPPQRQSQHVPLNPLNSPTHPHTSKTCGDLKATSSKTAHGTRQEHSNTSTVNTRPRRENISLTQVTQGSPAGQGSSDGEEGRPPVSCPYLDHFSATLLPLSDPT